MCFSEEWCYRGNSLIYIVHKSVFLCFYGIKTSIHLPFDHSLLVQNLTAQVSRDILEFDGMVCVYIVSKLAPYCLNVTKGYVAYVILMNYIVCCVELAF
jgi:hypothetical protein